MEEEIREEVNNVAREAVEGSDYSNLQIWFIEEGPLKSAYRGKNATQFAKASKFIDALEFKSFQDVLDDIENPENPENIFVDKDCKIFKNAARDFCKPRYNKMVRARLSERRVKDFKVQFEPAVRVCMTLPPFHDIQAALMNAGS